MTHPKESFNAIALCAWGNVALAVLIAFWLGVYPAWIAARNLQDPALRNGNIPRYAFAMHRTLSPKIARWAEQRVQSQRPNALTGENVSGTEWPLFGSVFYLWATEALQDAWEKEPHPNGTAPKDYARAAIAASARLVLDPKHASWVKKMYGASYMTQDDVFYRFLRIAAMTAQVRLLNDTSNLDLLRDEVDRLAADIDASPVGLLEDYPGECYPGDVAQALACIKRADTVLGADHGAMLARAYRGFDETKTEKPYGLPPYCAVARTGHIIIGTRGCSNSYFCMSGPELWPDAAKEWYDTYGKFFWQHDKLFAGFREFSRDQEAKDWYFDVDSGPCLAGYGFAATAFGLAAARINGRFYEAAPLTAEMIAASWTMPNGRMALPALLSNLSDAPFLGEQCILYTLTRTPLPGITVQKGGQIPLFPWLLIAAYLVCAVLLIYIFVRSARQTLNYPAKFPRFQTALWGASFLGSVILFDMGYALPATISLILALSFPLRLRCVPKKTAANTASVPV